MISTQRIGVGYLRISDPRLDSLDSQRHEIEAYAAEHNVRIVTWYCDEQPGWEENRDDFQRLLRDASGGGFEVVLARALDRFSRLSVRKLFVYLDRLSDCGVTLETVDDGPIDSDEGDDFGWIIAGVTGQAKRKYVSDLSRNVTSAKMKAARKGLWGAGPVAYGYKREDDGHLTLGPEIEVECVRYIFERYTSADVSLVELCDDLTERGYPSPSGKGWTSTGLRVILKRPHYLGRAPQLRQHRGKFYSAGTDRPAKAHKQRRQWKPESEWSYVECPQIVDDATWRRAQEMLKQRRTHTQPKSADGKSLFGGLLFCGDCGSPMWAEHKQKHGGGMERVYCCSVYMERGPKHCHRNPVKEAMLLDVVIPEIQARALSDVNIKKLKEALRRRVEKGKSRHSPAALKEARRRLDDLDKEIRLAIRELRRVDDDLHAAVSDDLRTLRAERADAEARVKALEATLDAPAEDVAAIVEDRIKMLYSLRERLESADRAVVRLALRSCVERVDCFHDHTAYATEGKRAITKHKVKKLTIKLVGGLYAPPAQGRPT